MATAPRTARTATATGKLVPLVPPASAFGPDNYRISEADGVVTIQFALGADLGPSASGKTHHVSKHDQSWRASDGTRISFTAYRK